MPERQLNKATHNRRAGNAVRGLALVGIAASAAGFAGHANAETHSSKIVDTNSSNSRLINNPNTSDTLKADGVNHEVVGLPQFRTVFSADLPKTMLAANLADADGNVDVTIKPGSSISQELKDDLSAKGVQLQSAEQVKAVVEAVGELGHDMVNPGDSFSFSASAVAEGVQNANVEVQVATTASPVAVENQQNDASSVGADTNVQKADENLAPTTEAAAITGETDPIAEATATPESAVLAQAAIAEASPVACISTDLKGTAVYTGNHISGDPVQFDLQNVQPPERQDCPDGVWIRSYSSNQNPNSAGWLESQSPMTSQIEVLNPDGSVKTRTSTAEGLVLIPNNTDDLKVRVDLPDGDYCWAQVETVTISDELVPPYYNGVNMVDYVLVPNPTKRNPDTCQVVNTATSTPENTKTPTPTYTASSTSTKTATNTPTFTVTSTETPVTGTATNTPSVPCFDTDRKGSITYTGNHVSGNPVSAHLQNVGAEGCPADFYVDIFGSKQLVTEGSDWLQSQHLISQKKYIVEPGSSTDISIDVPNLDDCNYQVDLGTTTETRADQLFGVKMIDYAFVKDVDSCLPTATATASPTVTFTPTSTFTETSTSTPSPTFTETRVPHTATSTSTATRTNTPVPPTSTSTRESKPTNTPKPKVTPGIVKDLPNTGVKSESRIAPWIAFGAGALGFMGLGSIGRGLNLLRTEEDETDEKKRNGKKRKIESKS